MSINRIPMLVGTTLLLIAAIIAGPWATADSFRGLDAMERSCIGVALEMPSGLMSTRWIDLNACRPRAAAPLAGPLKMYGKRCGPNAGRLIMTSYRPKVRDIDCRHERGVRI